MDRMQKCTESLEQPLKSHRDMALEIHTGQESFSCLHCDDIFLWDTEEEDEDEDGQVFGWIKWNTASGGCIYWKLFYLLEELVHPCICCTH